MKPLTIINWATEKGSKYESFKRTSLFTRMRQQYGS